MKKSIFLIVLFFHVLKSEASENSYTVTFSPVLAIYSIFEMSAEVKVSENVGVSIIYRWSDSKTSSVLVYGLQANYYDNSSFERGLHYGVELVKMDFTRKTISALSDQYERVLLGPYIGYKAFYESGITFVSQIGYQKHIPVFDTKYDAILLNLNIGYTF